jgi:hypothetical protein
MAPDTAATERAMRRGLSPAAALLFALALWAIAPIVVVIVRLLAYGDVPTGADGPLSGDQLQYLAWVRDAGSHGLASNLFELRPSAHAFVHPMFTVSGLGRWLGVPLVLAYWVWKPIAVGVLFAGTAALAARLLPGERLAQAAVIALALFSFTPIAALVGWAELGSAAGREDLIPSAWELFAAGSLWGYLPTSIAIGLMPAVVLTAERALCPERRGAGRGGGWYAAWGATAGVAISWLHPWQGVIMLLVLAGLAAWPGGAGARRRLFLLVPAAGLALPLAYYAGLAHWDSAWRLSRELNDVSPPPIWALVLALAPLALPALAGLRRPGTEVAERALVLWPVASLAGLVALTAYPIHALGGMSLPLAVLAVRGWRRLRLPAVAGAAAIALLTVPGAAFWAREFRIAVSEHPNQQLYLTASEDDALGWLSRNAPAGGVLAPPRLGEAVPERTGRHTWVGHPSWTSDYALRVSRATALFAGRMPAPTARAFVRSTGARLIVSDCASRPGLRALLGPAVVASRRFGCVAVYTLG